MLLLKIQLSVKKIIIRVESWAEQGNNLFLT